MSHETAQQRGRRHKRDPYRAAILAPLAQHPTLCHCTHPRSLHADLKTCQVKACKCPLFQEAT